MSARARAVRRAEGERLIRSAALLREGEPLTPAMRAALADLLEHLGGPAAEVVVTTVFDRAIKGRAGVVGTAPRHCHQRPAPNVGGGEASWKTEA